ncbi:MAG: phage tail sheath C-terminal domain-containing protein [Phaeodactylibacter sp.]|uniref:phage tail sheath family protein n=1 Tax=Phaeodactylibacter sp. TaxID=1940289 RepID=UPI0032EC1AB4
MAKAHKTPGVYVEEISAFPNSVVQVETAIPAFVGYTEKAVYSKKDLALKPTRVSSLGEFLLYFGGAPKTTYSIENARQQDPNKPYKIKPHGNRYLLFYSMKLFFANGGSDCFIVSVGDYNDAITQSCLTQGIQTLDQEREPTMLVIPDAVLLEQQECYALQQTMLSHCGSLRDRITILDIFDGFKERTTGDDVITAFRTGIGSEHLQWGAAYYPWVETNIVGADEVDPPPIEKGSMIAFIGLLKEDIELQLKAGLLKQSQADDINAVIERLRPTKVSHTEKAGKEDKSKPPSKEEIHQTLLATHPLYKEIMQSVRAHLSLLPPSGGMAGIYSMVDHTIGVWQSPANVSMSSVVKPAVNITSYEQEDLNVSLDGKAVNAIRTFPGKGVLVWGARTLDGNSGEWRYISVRRTATFIEQSVKFAAEAFVFEPNDSNTWTSLNAMIRNFLTNIWREGALAGPTPEHAFFVNIGLGTTMTPADISEGWMKINIGVAVTRPTEFMVITLQQRMQPA